MSDDKLFEYTLGNVELIRGADPKIAPNTITIAIRQESAEKQQKNMVSWEKLNRQVSLLTYKLKKHIQLLVG